MDFIWDAPVFTCMSLYETVKIDDLYFKATGGGVTFGGEIGRASCRERV